MVSKSKRKPKATQKRNLSSSARKLSDQEINTFLVVLSALMAEVPAPRDARKKYLKDVENRLRNNGVAFLSQSRSFPTYGLKLLGGDLDGFPIPNFKQAKGKPYPQLFAWYWAELERLSKLAKPTATDAKMAQRVLCVLSFAKMLKISTVNQIKKALFEFENRITESSSGASNTSSTKPDVDERPVEADEQHKDFVNLVAGLSLTKELGVKMEFINSLPRYVDFNSISTKPSALASQPALPEFFAAEFMKLGRDDQGNAVMKLPTVGIKGPPYGKVCVLTEAGGKLRFVVPYNSPFVHSTGLYARCVAILRSIVHDCSGDQSIGHRKIQKFTQNCGNLGTSEYIISADLSSWSDTTVEDAVRYCLNEIGLYGLEDYILNLPVCTPNGKVITPTKPLMGLKGCFELSSVLHHLAVKLAGINDYALCGDDLAFIGQLGPYEEVITPFGWSLNRNKTVRSKTAAVFCGEFYWYGYRVSARVPKVHTCYKNSKLRRASVLFSVVRDAIASLNTIYSARGVDRIIGPLLALLRKKWKGVIVPTMPSKLRGLGKRPRKGSSLLTLMKNKAILRVCLMSIGIEPEHVSTNRWFGLPIQITPEKIVQELPDFPALLSKGAVQLRVTPIGKPMVKHVESLDLYQALEWYYDDTRLEASCFEKG